MKKHRVKIYPYYFNGVASGYKTFEIRKFDREFEEGDLLSLEEWDEGAQRYTGRVIEVAVTYLLTDIPGLYKGYCILGIKRL